MNRLARNHGFGVALAVGVALIGIGVVWQRPEVLFVGLILTVLGAVARPVEKFALNRTGMSVKWQKEAAEKVVERIVERVVPATRSGSFTADAVIAEAGHAHGTGQAHDATAQTASGQAAAEVTRPQTPDEFAETVIKAIEPILQRIELPFIDSGSRVFGPSDEPDAGG